MNTGELWGPYRILHYLGSGAMGEVYFARNEKEGRDVAVKRVRRNPGIDGEEKLAAERLGAELEKQLSAIDRRVTKLFWYGDIEQDLAIEMEYIDGQDLSTVLAAAAIAPGRAAVIALELCEMLENLRAFETQIDGRHLSGVIHGDLKPKNVRIDSHNQIKVMDFGVAKALSRTRDYTASLFGSIAYCSPERLDSGSMDSNSDLWSVGVMLYQMVSARLPFAGETPERLERRIRADQPPAALTCPAPLSNIVFKMLSRNLADRYPNAMAVHADLERFLKGEQVQAPAPELANSVDLDATIRTPRPAALRAAALAAPSHALRNLLATALAALLAISVLLFLLIRPQYLAWADTRQLKHDIETEHVDANAAWDRYEQIVKRKHLSVLTWGIGSPLRNKLMSAGEAPIADFRENDYPTAREGQWRRSIVYFSRALELEPGDRTIQGKLRLCEGHLQRITAAGASRQQMLNDSADKFRQAADLLKKSPDPYIGLARLYSYNLGDCDRAQEALKKAVQYGHPETRREIATLADSYLRRGAQTLRDSQKFHTLPDNERDYLKRARKDFEQAQDLYSRLGSFANAPANLMGSIRNINQVNNRLEEMDMLTR
jgi:serine/threonine protein kinase